MYLEHLDILNPLTRYSMTTHSFRCTFFRMYYTRLKKFFVTVHFGDIGICHISSFIPFHTIITPNTSTLLECPLLFPYSFFPSNYGLFHPSRDFTYKLWYYLYELHFKIYTHMYKVL